MTQTLVREETQIIEEGNAPLVIRFEPVIEMTSELFEQFCALNDDLRIELTAGGTIEVMPPAFSHTGNRNSIITTQLGMWTHQSGSGISFDSSAGFTLPNGAVRSPDASWISLARLEALSEEERSGFFSVCPDFVVELRSASDRLSVLQSKMEEYMANGARLGWLLDPIERRAHVYRPGAEVEILHNPDALSGNPELPGFTLDLKPIWEPVV